MPGSRPRPRRFRRAFGLAACLAALIVAACGKKGPPLPPFSHVPGAPPEAKVRRKGDRVEVQFKVPSANSDGRAPAHIDSVAVYALTGPGTDVTTPIFRKHAEPVASAVVREPPPPPPELKEGQPPPPPPPPRTDPGLDQGQPAVLWDTFTPADLLPLTMKEIVKARALREKQLKANPPPEPTVTPPEFGPPFAVPDVRYYAVVGLNGNDKGTFSQLFRVPLDEPPPAPAAPEIALAERRIDVSWTAPEGLRRPVLPNSLPPIAPTPAAVPVTSTPAAGAVPEEPSDDEDETPPAQPEAAPPAEAPAVPAAPPTIAEPAATAAPQAPAAPAAEGAAPPAAPAEGQPPAPGEPAAPPAEPPPLPARLLASFTTTTYTYAVYETAPPGFTPPPLQDGFVPRYPLLLTAAPVALTKWADTRFEAGSTHCYAVSTIATTGPVSVESAMSPSACVTARDTFAPAAPKGLAAVASVGAISLIWDANTEIDLAGYLVLRAPADGGELAPLTRLPIKETTYRDATVRRGVRYVYAIVAVDTAKPPNRSAESPHVEETAR